MVKPPTLRERAPFVVEDLAASLHTTARLGVVDGLEVAYVEKKPGPEPGTLFPNPARLPLHATAVGKVLLAFGSRSLVRVLGGWRPSAVHRQDPRRPDRSRGRPPEDQGPRLRPRGQRAPAGFRCRRGTRVRRPRKVDRRHRGGGGPRPRRGRARRSRVADGRALPPTGDHTRGAPASRDERHDRGLPARVRLQAVGGGLESALRSRRVAQPRDVQRDARAVRARRPPAPAGIRRSPRR